MITITVKDEDCEILNSIDIEVPEDRTDEDMGNEIEGVIEDFFEVIET